MNKLSKPIIASICCCLLFAVTVSGEEIKLPLDYKFKHGDGTSKIVRVEPDGIIYEYQENDADDEKYVIWMKIPAKDLGDEDLKFFSLDKAKALEFAETHTINKNNLLGLKSSREEFVKAYGFPYVSAHKKVREIKIIESAALPIKPQVLQMDSYSTSGGTAHVYYYKNKAVAACYFLNRQKTVSEPENYPDYDEIWIKTFLNSTQPEKQWKFEKMETHSYYYTDDYFAAVLSGNGKIKTMTMYDNKFAEQNKP